MTRCGCSARLGQDFEALKKRAQTREFKPVPLGDATFSAQLSGEAARRSARRTCSGDLRHARIPTKRSSTARTGITSASVRRMREAIPSTTARWITAPALRPCSSSRACSPPGPKPQRSLVFAFWTAEEKGLDGLRVLREQSCYPLETTVAGFNIDALSAAGRAHDVVVVGSGQSDLEDRLKTVLAAHNRVMRPTRIPRRATSSDRITSRWRSAACRCSTWTAASIC